MDEISAKTDAPDTAPADSLTMIVLPDSFDCGPSGCAMPAVPEEGT